MADEIKDSLLQSDLEIGEKNSPIIKNNKITNFNSNTAYANDPSRIAFGTPFNDINAYSNYTAKAYTNRKFKFPRVKQLKPGEIKWN